MIDLRFVYKSRWNCNEFANKQTNKQTKRINEHTFNSLKNEHRCDRPIENQRQLRNSGVGFRVESD